jgi:hypothetical protein
MNRLGFLALTVVSLACQLRPACGNDHAAANDLGTVTHVASVDFFRLGDEQPTVTNGNRHATSAAIVSESKPQTFDHAATLALSVALEGHFDQLPKSSGQRQLLFRSFLATVRLRI